MDAVCHDGPVMAVVARAAVVAAGEAAAARQRSLVAGRAILILGQ
ncbi:hypothetical protein [Corallococcus sp. AB045]|nr:hypothetical protein [Corallococcus sp. AB045]